MPASANCTLGIVTTPLLDETGEPPRVQDVVGAGSPVAIQSSTTGEPSRTVMLVRGGITGLAVRGGRERGEREGGREREIWKEGERCYNQHVAYNVTHLKPCDHTDVLPLR